MSIIETSELKQLSRQQPNFCCLPIQYYSCPQSILVNTLQILPRIIIYKKSLTICKTYETVVTVTNQGLHYRRLIYTTDSEDVKIIVAPKQVKSYCINQSFDQSFELTILLQPKTKLNINRRRHIFIQAEHPNIILTIPIIILSKKDATPSLPDTITFPSSCVKSCTFYEMILYNKSAEKLAFSLKCNHTNLTMIVSKTCIPKRDYIKILLKLSCTDSMEIRDLIKLKFGLDSYEIPFVHRPIEWSLFLDSLYIQFDPLTFNRSSKKTFRICNESSIHAIRFHLKLAAPDENAVQQITGKNRLNVHSSIPSISSSSSSSLPHPGTFENKGSDAFPWKHFEYEPECGTLAPNTSSLITVTFRPIMHSHFNPVEPPPFTIFSSLIVNAQNELKGEQMAVIIRGSINGPEIDINPKIIDFHNVYFGEEHCAQIQVVNIDGITDCHVDFYDYIGHDDANVIVTPKDGFDLKPCESGMFHLQFFAKSVGKIMIKLKFKVRCGGFFSSMVRGYSQHVRVKCFPDILDMGILPVCVPQKRLVLLMNPLTVPITVQCSVPEDGSETPLVLNIIDTDEHFPIHVKDPIYHMDKCLQQENQKLVEGENAFDKQEEEEMTIEESFEFNYEDTESSLLSYHSVMDENSSFSTEFQEQALDLIPGMAPNLLHYLKKIKIFDKPDMEKKVVEEVLNSLLKTPYFYDMDKHKNYCSMDWNSLPSDPREIYCNNEIIYLNPNTGKAITVVVIPNTIGRQQNYLEFRVCPIMLAAADDEHPNLRQVVDSVHLKSKLWIEYNCSVPEVMWDNVIDMQDALYCGELYDFEMIFENCSKIGGFFYYEAIPDNEYGCMRFLNDRWKYFVSPASIEKVPCAVEFKKTGFITLLGFIKFVGVDVGFPFHIKSEVLPPRITFTPQQIVMKLAVLEVKNYYVYIDNVTPTTTWFRLKLKDVSNIFLHPQGAQLAPTGQGMYAALTFFYRDPGIYRNVLYLYMQYETVEKIPITLHVDGMPIFFEPEIRSSGLNMGYVLCNVEGEHLADKPCYSKAIRVINKGERYYRIVITKTKCSAKPICSINPSQAKVYIKPNCLAMEPMSEEYITISTYACEECSMYNEFRVDIIDASEPTRKQSTRFFLKAEFIYPQLAWNRREITMEYIRTHKYKEHDQWEIIKLTNVANNFMELVNLKVSGPFLLKENFEDRYAKGLEFSMKSLETKELFVILDKEAIRNRLNTFYEGRITCLANAKNQKHVYLKVHMFIPTLTVLNHDVVLFTKNEEGGTYIQLHNRCPVQAIYKWKKLQEEWHYVKEEDDSQQLAEIILSDVIRMLDLEPCDHEDNTELNCVIDPIDIRGLIHEVIDSLDLMHKRYQLERKNPPPPTFISELFHGIQKNKDTIKELGVKNTYDITLYRDSTKDLQSQIDEALHMLAQQQHGQVLEQISKIEHQLNSKTLYFNRKFRIDPSSYNSDNIVATSSETCVYHTLDHVMGNLKLEDSYTVSEASSDICAPESSVYFFEKCGILEANQQEMCALHIPAIRKGFEVDALFRLDVIGGKSQKFHITCVNLDKALKLSKDSVYLGLKPWYESFKTKVKAENLTNYDINLKLFLLPKFPDKLPKLANGFVRIINERTLKLSAFESIFLKTEGIMGLSDEFIREIRITINERDDINLRLRGHGVMPILTVANHTIPYVERDMFEIEEEYRLLQKIYYFEIFKAITEIDEELPGPPTEDNEVKKALSMIMELTLSSSSFNSESKSSMESSRSTARYEHELRFFRLLQTYVLVNNNEELPNATILNQLLETERFLNLLRCNEEICCLLNLVHQDYLRHSINTDDKLTINLKHFTIQPLPFQLRGVIWDLNQLVLNQYRKFVLTLEFFGPGKLIASARTVKKIPGLLVDFQVVENTGDKDFIYYRSEVKFPDNYEKPYRNMSERLVAAKTDPKLKHAHSYDVNIRSQHQRDVSGKERKWMMEQYSSLNKSVYIDRKLHFTHSKIFTNCKYNFSGTKINIILLLRPQREHYKPNQRIEDYLYIDLHMGPTLPILLRGTIMNRSQEQK